MNEQFWNRIRIAVERFDPDGDWDALGIEIAEVVRGVDVSRLESEIQRVIVPENRRYGRGGLNLTPLGYYHPTEIMDFICDNVRRGRFTRDPERCDYIYDYNGQSQIVRVQLGDMISFCVRDGQLACFLCVDRHTEIICAHIAQYDAQGDAALIIKLIPDPYRSNTFFEIETEQYRGGKQDIRECEWCQYCPKEISSHPILVRHSYRIHYAHKKVIDWEEINPPR